MSVLLQTCKAVNANNVVYRCVWLSWHTVGTTAFVGQSVEFGLSNSALREFGLGLGLVFFFPFMT
jgi:hypothetical protein